MKRFLEYTLRGYGQLFLCNSPRVGVYFLAGLIIASPINALWSFVGGSIVTLLALWLAKPKSLVKSGLFGVNGVLLGCLWGYYPELTETAKGISTALGSILMALVLVPSTQWLKEKKSPYVLFSVPYVLAAWLCLTALSWLGHTDPRLSAGWKALAEGRLDLSRNIFSDKLLEAKLASERAKVLLSSGNGWSHLEFGLYPLAGEHFREALLRDDTLANAFDGLGWACFHLGKRDAAQTAFECAVTEDRWLADSWDGLGWLALQSREAMPGYANKAVLLTPKLETANECFSQAVLRAPFLSDAWSGLATCRDMQHQENDAVRFILVSGWLKRHVAKRYQFTSLRQFACWFLFFFGIVMHSRLSALFASSSLGVCIAGAHFLPSYANVFQDIHFVYNLIGIFLVCGGLYLRVSILTVPWLCAVSAALVIFWAQCADVMIGAGLPLLCLPFNIVLVTSIAFFLTLRRLCITDQVVPLAWASSGSPESVRMWMMKHDIARQCWARLKAK